MASVHSVASLPATGRVVHFYRLVAAADPGMLPRAVGLFAKLGLVPDRCSAVTEDSARLVIELTVGGLEGRMADHIAACMRQIYGVEQVLAWQEPAAG